MSTFLKKLFVVIVFTGVAGYAGAVGNAASPVAAIALNTELQSTPTLPVANAAEIRLAQRTTDAAGSRPQGSTVGTGERLQATQTTSATADWSLLLCGLVIGVFIAQHRLKAFRP